MSVKKDNINVEPDSSNNEFDNNMQPKHDQDSNCTSCKCDEDLSKSLPIKRYLIEVNLDDCKLGDDPLKPPPCKHDKDSPKPPCGKPDKEPPKSPYCKPDYDLPKPPPCKPDDDLPKPPHCKPDDDHPKPPPCKHDDDLPKPAHCKPDDDLPKPPPCKPDKDPPKPPPPDECSKHPYNSPNKMPKVSINLLIVIFFIIVGLVCGIEGFFIDFRVYKDKWDNETTATETTICQEKIRDYKEDHYEELNEHEEDDAEEGSDSNTTIEVGEIRLSDTDKTYGMNYEQGYLYVYAIPAEIFEYYGEDEDDFTEGLEYDIYDCLPESINSDGNVDLIAEKVQNEFYAISSWENPQELRLEIITLE